MDKTLLRKWALQNAVKYEGKANVGAVIGKLLSHDPSLKNDMKLLSGTVQLVVKEVNAMKPKDQLFELQQIAPELLIEKKKEETHELPPLPDAVNEKVITAFPPEPSGVAHIGHAAGALFNWAYAKRYGGKFILRFEDTNPELAKKEYYTAISELLHWLGIDWDKQVNISDTLPEMYTLTQKCIDKGIFYACLCDVEFMRKKRELCEECEHRTMNPIDTKKIWNDMLLGKYEEGAVSIRYKGEMSHNNGVMRDPVMFRIIKKPHCLHGTKYCVWPSYDVAAAYSDGVEGITHRVRGKEFELRAELQTELQKHMGFKPTLIIEQARINLVGVEASKRKIREKIANKELQGWDDIRLTTLIALRRRGYTPEGIKNFLFNIGITKNERTLEWASLEAENRKIIDPISNRYFFVPEPVNVKILGAKEKACSIPLHPEKPEVGRRVINSNEEFYLAKSDVAEIKQRKIYRLMDCCNFTKTTKGYKLHSLEFSEVREKEPQILQWLSAEALNEEAPIPIEVMMPDASTITGLGEAGLRELAVGTEVQFVRFGFCRLDKKEKEKIVFWYTHK